MSVFWPRARSLNPSDDLSVRAGRLLHYLGALIAVGWVALALIWNENGNGYATPAGLGVAAVFFFAGRALRYLLAAE